MKRIALLIVAIVLTLTGCSTTQPTISTTTAETTLSIVQSLIAARSKEVTPSPTPTPRVFTAFPIADYSKVSRNPNEYIGKDLKFSGKIFQVISEGVGIREFLVYQDSDVNKLWYVKMVTPPNTSRILERDVVYFFGSPRGLFTYENALGVNKTIPSFYAERFNVLKEAD